MFYLNKKIAAVFMVLALWVCATPGYTQDYEPWTGSVVGATINFGNNETLDTIRKLINEGKTEGAVRESQKLVNRVMQNERSGEISSVQYDAYNALCLSLTANKQFDEAMAACDNAIERSARRWQAFNSRGSLNYKTGKYTEALSDYRNALERIPNVKNIKRIIEHNIRISEARSSGN